MTQYLAGVGKADMTAFFPGVGMMGYGQFHNVVKDIATPLSARALVIQQDSSKFILVHLEQAFVTLAIRLELVARLNVPEENLMVTAQHTHSAPGGYSHYPFYNITIPGFQKKVFEKVISASLEAIEAATKDLSPVTLSFGETAISEDKEVAFNRSIPAYNQNPEVQKTSEKDKHLAVNRQMQGLFIHKLNGDLKAHLNWFGVHCTSVSSYNQRIHHDNKGVAAKLFEDNHPGSVAFFLQASAGDVSPNFIWNKKLKRMVGKFDDQYESAAFNGEIQFRESEKIVPQKIEGPLASALKYFDFSKRVMTPAHGVGFFQGTLEGPGIPHSLGAVLKQISRLVRKIHLMKNPELHAKFYAAHGNKDVMLDHRNGSFGAVPLGFWKKLPPLPDPTADAFRKTARNNALETLPWIPSILPLQLLRLGPLLIVGCPGEITTVSARRLVKRLKAETLDQGITHFVITSYTNAYMGYLTTPEEYDAQMYEGGHNVFGRGSLDSFIEGFAELVPLLKGEAPNLEPVMPFRFPQDELDRRSV